MADATPACSDTSPSFAQRSSRFGRALLVLIGIRMALQLPVILSVLAYVYFAQPDPDAVAIPGWLDFALGMVLLLISLWAAVLSYGRVPLTGWLNLFRWLGVIALVLVFIGLITGVYSALGVPHV